MRFLHHDLGYRSAGETVEIRLRGNAANVRLLDSTNFNAYRAGRAYRGVMGVQKRSPAHMRIPHAGNWHVAIDMQGLRGQTNASVSVLPAPLPELRSTRASSPLASLVRSIEEVSEAPKSYDVFISHASEDKAEVARPLAEALRKCGLTVWYDEFELKIGASLRRSIDRGVANSRFGVVVFSESFFAKNWPQYELDGLVTREMSGQQTILPLWHRITKAQVISHSPSLADKLARNTTDFTIDQIADEIAAVVRPGGIPESDLT